MTATLPRDASAAATPAIHSAEGALVEGTVAVPVAGRERLLSLDVFRGITIAGMLLVNNPGSWGAIYPPLEHAPWFGWTPTDLIFPFFLFIVGITTRLSFAARRARGADDRALLRRLVRRGLTIIALGLLMSGFPYHQLYLHLPLGAVFDSRTAQLDLAHWRFTGVLQRIGVAYILGALLNFRTTVKQQVVILAALLYGYWLVMTLVPVPGHGLGALMLGSPDGSLAAWLDRTIIGTNHMWAGSRSWDPEGLLSTVPAIGTVVLGYLAGRWIGRERPLLERITALFAAGAMAMAAGLMWNWSFPIAKNIWSSSYVLFTAGMACVTLATCMWLIDVERRSGWTRPFVIYGVNPIVAFVASGFFSRFIYTLVKVPHRGALVPVETAIYDSAFASWLAPRDASLAFAIVYVLVFLAFLTLMWRRNIIIKV